MQQHLVFTQYERHNCMPGWQGLVVTNMHQLQHTRGFANQLCGPQSSRIPSDLHSKPTMMPGMARHSDAVTDTCCCIAGVLFSCTAATEGTLRGADHGNLRKQRRVAPSGQQSASWFAEKAQRPVTSQVSLTATQGQCHGLPWWCTH